MDLADTTCPLSHLSRLWPSSLLLALSPLRLRARFIIGERRSAKPVSHPKTETVLSNKITRNRMVLSLKDSPRKRLRRRQYVFLTSSAAIRLFGDRTAVASRVVDDRRRKL